MSLVLRPDLNADNAVLITTAASVAVCRAIEKITGLQADIKWVNDVYLNGKKICGILTEAVTDFETGTIDAVVLGIGINCSTGMFPEEMVKTAGSLSDLTAKVSRNKLVAAVIDEVLGVAEELSDRSFIPEYKRRSMVLGKNIRVISKDTQRFAKVLDIDNNGGLSVRMEDGSVTVLNSGEISIRPMEPGKESRPK